MRAILSCGHGAPLLSSAAHAPASLSPFVDLPLTFARASRRARQARKWSLPSAFFR